MERGSSRRWPAIIAAGGGALVFLLLVVVLVTQEVGPAPLSTPAPTSPSDPSVAVVNGQPISRNFWLEAVLMDQVMSRLASVPVPEPEETLERLINEALVVQAAPPEETPTDEEIEAYISALEAAWGVNDALVVTALERVGLGRESLERTVVRLLVIQHAQETLEAEGASIEDWLTQERAEAEIVIYEDLADAGNLPDLVMQAMTDLLQPSPAPAPTPSPIPSPDAVLDLAPDFTLQRASEGTFTLSEQLAQGPLVLVFFQRRG